MSNADEWVAMYDGGDASQEFKRTKTELGQSPGVKFPLPLHRVHEIKQLEPGPLRFFRVFIVKPAAGWGVSLWQVKVYGTSA
jgi:hypothetical protein